MTDRSRLLFIFVLICCVDCLSISVIKNELSNILLLQNLHIHYVDLRCVFNQPTVAYVLAKILFLTFSKLLQVRPTFPFQRLARAEKKTWYLLE